MPRILDFVIVLVIVLVLVSCSKNRVLELIGLRNSKYIRLQSDAATREDFARLRDMGANCVLVFLSYNPFSMEPGCLSPEGVAKFDQFLALAEEAGLYVHPTGLSTWEAGTPTWVTPSDPWGFVEETIAVARDDFWRAFAARYRDCATIFAYDLLNEPSIGWDSPAMVAHWNRWLATRYPDTEALADAWDVPAGTLSGGDLPVPPNADAPGDARLLDFQHFREGLAERWVQRQAQAIKSADPAALVTVGLIQWSVPITPVIRTVPQLWIGGKCLIVSASPENGPSGSGHRFKASLTLRRKPNRNLDNNPIAHGNAVGRVAN